MMQVIYSILIGIIFISVMIALISSANSYDNVAKIFSIIAGVAIFTLTMVVITENKIEEETYKQAIKDMHNDELKYEMHIKSNNDTIIYKIKK